MNSISVLFLISSILAAVFGSPIPYPRPVSLQCYIVPSSSPSTPSPQPTQASNNDYRTPPSWPRQFFTTTTTTANPIESTTIPEEWSNVIWSKIYSTGKPEVETTTTEEPDSWWSP